MIAFAKRNKALTKKRLFLEYNNHNNPKGLSAAMMVTSITIATGTLMGVVMANVMANAVVAMRGFLLPSAIKKGEKYDLDMDDTEGKGKDENKEKGEWTKEEEFLIVSS